MNYPQEALQYVQGNYPDQPEFIQSVEEVYQLLEPELAHHPEYRQYRLLERMASPERIISFRVVWENDDGGIEINRGYRVQFHTVLGPGKGGLRFDPTVNASVLSFLAFEQSFKNALTSLALGAAKGGSDFDPHGRSDQEIMRFCRSFMTELYRHIGPSTDIPAGDIGVGSRELGYLFGQYRRITGRWEGVLTGKGVGWGGSEFRAEATGVGAVQFADFLAEDLGDKVFGSTILISGAGNVALHAAEELITRGAEVRTLSDSGGTLYVPDGITAEALKHIRTVKEVTHGGLEDVEISEKCEYLPGDKPWQFEGDFAFPCATQNEIEGADAKKLAQLGIKYVIEGANMPCTAAALRIFREQGVVVAPGKAANAGGVAVSGLEMYQNTTYEQWGRHRVKKELRTIIKSVYDQCIETAAEFGQPRNLALGANIAGFRRLAKGIIAQGHN